MQLQRGTCLNYAVKRLEIDADVLRDFVFPKV